MISALVVVLVTFALTSASPLAERQSRCTPVAIPQQCLQAQADYNARFAQILANSSSAQQIKEILVPLLNTLCGSTCLDPFQNNITCVRNLTDATVNFLRARTCGKNGNEFCAIQQLDFLRDGINLFPPCASSETCASSCRSTLTTIVNRWGCCAAVWYTDIASPFASVSNQFRTCGVSLGNVCAAAAVHYLSVMLLFVASALAIFIL